MTKLWHALEWIRMKVQQALYIRKWKRCRLKETICEHPCEELGWCPYVGKPRCKGCEEESEVWE